MTIDEKNKCYSAIYQSLKTNPTITDLTYPEERKNFDFSCKIGPIDITFSLLYERDQCMIRGVFASDKGAKNTSSFLSDLTNGKNISGFGSPEAGILSTSVLLQDLSDEKAEEKLTQAADEYFSFLADNRQAIEDFISADPKPEKETESKENAGLLGSVLLGMGSGSVMGERGKEKTSENIPEKADEKAPEVKSKPLKKPMKKPEVKKELEHLKKEKSESLMAEKALEKEKAEFKQYCIDQRRLFDNEAEELKKKKETVAALEKELANDKQQFALKKAELEQLEKNLAADKASFKEKQKALNGQLIGLNKEKQELKAEKDKWDNTSLDDKLIQRRKELEKMEANFYKKEKDFQDFQNNTLSDISSRLDTVAEKEKEMLKKQDDIRKQQDDQKTLEEEIDLRYKKLQEKEKQIAKKEAELSDLEASLRRTEIIKQDAENELRKLEIQKKNFSIRVEQQDIKEEDFRKEKDAFSKKYHDVMLDIASLDDKKKALEEKETELRTLIGKNEALESQLKGLKEDTDKTTSIIKEKDDEVARKEDIIIKQKKSLKVIEDKLRQEQKKTAATSKENASLKERMVKAEEQTKAYETEIAKVRTELYTTKEALKLKPAVEPKVEKSIEKPVEKTVAPVVKDNPETLLKMKKLQESERWLKENNEVLTKNIKTLELRCKQAETDRDKMEADSLNQIGELQEQITTLEQKIIKIDEQEVSVEEFNPDSIGAQPVVGERDGLYALETEGCVLYIDVENHVIQVKKEVRKPSKYVKEVMRLNQEDITETYFVQRSFVGCRKTYKTDVTEAMQNVLASFANFR